MPDLINSYATDLICMPFVFIICLFFVRLLKRDNTLVIKPWIIALLCLQYIVVFEIILPMKSSIYTADFIDAVMYIIGSIIFFFMQPILTPKISVASN